MGLRDVLFGRKKLPGPKEDRLFALSTAAVTLDTECGLKPAGAAAITFKPQSSGEFKSAFDDVDQLVEAAAQSAGSTIARQSDDYGYEWLIVRDPDLEDVVSTVHVVASELIAKGFGEQLLAGMREDLPGTVVFIFQPAEEGSALFRPNEGRSWGAKLMLEDLK